MSDDDNKTKQSDNGDSDPIQLLENFDEKKARNWYEQVREKIRAWLERHVGSEWAEILLFLPDLFMFAVGIMRDPRIPLKYRLALLSAVLYVLSPLDIIPEMVFGAPGLIDDAGILIILLDLLFNSLILDSETWAEVIRDHWHREEDLASTITRLLAKLRDLSGDLFEKLLNLVKRWWPERTGGEPDADPAV